jgi:hypothetical protein
VLLNPFLIHLTFHNVDSCSLVLVVIFIELNIDVEIIWPLSWSQHNEKKEHDEDWNKVLGEKDFRSSFFVACECVDDCIDHFICVVEHKDNPELKHDLSFKLERVEGEFISSQDDLSSKHCDVLVASSWDLNDYPNMHESKHHCESEPKLREILDNEVCWVNKIEQSDCHGDVTQFFSIEVPLHNGTSLWEEHCEPNEKRIVNSVERHLNDLQVFDILPCSVCPGATHPSKPIDKRVEQIEQRDYNHQFLEIKRLTSKNDVSHENMEDQDKSPKNKENVEHEDLILDHKAIIDELMLMIDHWPSCQWVRSLDDFWNGDSFSKTNDLGAFEVGGFTSDSDVVVKIEYYTFDLR